MFLSFQLFSDLIMTLSLIDSKDRSLCSSWSSSVWFTRAVVRCGLTTLHKTFLVKFCVHEQKWGKIETRAEKQKGSRPTCVTWQSASVVGGPTKDAHQSHSVTPQLGRGQKIRLHCGLQGNLSSCTWSNPWVNFYGDFTLLWIYSKICLQSIVVLIICN